MLGINSVYSPYITRIGFQNKKNHTQKFSLKNETLEKLQRQQSILKGEKPDIEIDMKKIADELVMYINGENPEETITIGDRKVPLTNGSKLFEEVMAKEKEKKLYLEIQALLSVFSYVSCESENSVNNNLYKNNYNRNTKERINRIDTLYDVQKTLTEKIKNDINPNRKKRIKKKN